MKTTGYYSPFVEDQCLASKTQCRKASRNNSQNRTRNMMEEKNMFWLVTTYV